MGCKWEIPRRKALKAELTAVRIADPQEALTSCPGGVRRGNLGRQGQKAGVASLEAKT